MPVTTRRSGCKCLRSGKLLFVVKTTNNDTNDAPGKKRNAEASIGNVVTPSPDKKRRLNNEEENYKQRSCERNLLADLRTSESFELGQSICKRYVAKRHLELAEIYSRPPMQAVPWNDVCFKCRQSGHWSGECPGIPGMTSEEVRLHILGHKADYESVCVDCLSPVNKGDIIIPTEKPFFDSSEASRTKRWIHHDCWKSKIAVRAANQENLLNIESRKNREVDTIIRRVNRGKSTLVSSVAGSGKTELLARLYDQSSHKAILALAFNKAAAQELCERGVQTAMTYHSYGYNILNEFSKQGRISCFPFVNTNKTKALLERWCIKTGDVAMGSQKKYKIGLMTSPVQSEVIRLVSLAKVHRLGISDIKTLSKENLSALDKKYEIAKSSVQDYVVKCTHWILKQSIKMAIEEGEIDFDDQIYMPLQLRKPGERFLDGKYPLILMDEAQDTNIIRMALIARSLPKGGQVIAVGDQLQAIYGFTGAGSDSMSKIQKIFKTGEPLPLSVSWRLPSLHATFVNKFLLRHANILGMPELLQSVSSSSLSSDAEHVKAAPDAGLGLLVLSHGTFSDYPIEQDSAVICRMNAPLVHLFFALARHNIVARFLGRKEIGSGMKKKLAEALKQYGSQILPSDSITQAEKALRLLRSKLIDDEGNSDGTIYNDKDLIDCVVSIIGCLRDTAEESQRSRPLTLRDLEKRLLEFSTCEISDGPQGRTKYITLCSIHKAKGMGFHRVYILQPNDLPLPTVMEYGQSWKKEQELHVAYVAYTRSYSDLIFLRHVDLRRGKAAMDELWDDENTDEDKDNGSSIQETEEEYSSDEESSNS